MTPKPHRRASQAIATNGQPSANWRPGQPWRERKDVPHSIAGACSILRSVARRDDFDVPNLADLAAVADQLDVALAMAVANLRERGYSWGDIASVLGVTRQSAHERFRRHGIK